MKKIRKLTELNIKKPYLAKISWMDAVGSAEWFGGSNSVLDWANGTDSAIVEVGWLLHKDSDRVILASRKHLYNDGSVNWGMIQWIPRPWIVKLVRVKTNG